MADWVTPRTWTDGELVDSSIANVHFRNQLNAIFPNYLSKSASASILATDGRNVVVLADTSSGAMTINAPPAATVVGMFITIKKTNSGSNAVTFDPNGTELVDGASTHASTIQHRSTTYAAASTPSAAWYIVGER